jgi:flagellar basal body rod protein FlgB
MNRHTPKNSNNVEIDEELPKAAKIRIAPKKTATKNQKKANIE